MILIKKGVSPESIRLSSRHTLFVEGADQEAIDPQVLSILLDDTNVRVMPLGPSVHITSAAEALHPHHPDYYFLIDRDHRSQAAVDESWANFPNKETYNLLIWRLRELESYFLDPKYLLQSEYVTASSGEIVLSIESAANRQLYMDIANLVIIEVRETLKEKWIECFSNPNQCRDEKATLSILTTRAEFAQQKKTFGIKTTPTSLKNRFYELLDIATDNRRRVSYDSGNWKSTLKGKPIWNSTASACFKVHDNKNHLINGREKSMAVVRGLLRLDLPNQPDDFQKLHGLIKQRIRASGR